MDLRVREGEAEQDGIDVEDIAEGLDDRDAAAFANEDRFLAEGLAQGFLGGLAEGAVGIGVEGLSIMAADVEQRDAGRA